MSTNNESERGRQMLLNLCHQAEQAEAKAAVLNPIISELARAGALPTTVIAGPFLLSRPYNDGADFSNRSRVYQAAIVIPDGIGVLTWDSEVLFECRNREPQELSDDKWRFIPFAECDLVLKAALLPQLSRLFTRLWKRL